MFIDMASCECGQPALGQSLVAIGDAGGLVGTSVLASGIEELTRMQEAGDLGPGGCHGGCVERMSRRGPW